MDTDRFKILVSMFTNQLPVLIVCLAACVVIITRWDQASTGSLWALLGFGLGAFLCVIIPLVQTIIQHWVIKSGGSYRAPVLSVLPIMWSLLRAASYVMLLVAVFAGRPTSQTASSIGSQRYGPG